MSEETRTIARVKLRSMMLPALRASSENVYGARNPRPSMTSCPPGAIFDGVTFVICGETGSRTLKIGPVVVRWPLASARLMAIFPTATDGTSTTCESDAVETTVARVSPNVTTSLARKREPLIVMRWPTEPASGSMSETDGDGSSAVVQVNADFNGAVESVQRSERSAVPALCAGASTVTLSGRLVERIFAVILSKKTPQELRRFDPLTVTTVPPAVDPNPGVTDVS